MSHIKKKLNFAVDLLKGGNLKLVLDAFTRRLYSVEVAYGFKRDLDKNYMAPRSLKKITVRRAEESDDEHFPNWKTDGLIKNFDTCYVGVDEKQIPCCKLWIIDSSENNKLYDAWGDNFPVLEENEVLIENVYTATKFRGLGILPVTVHEVLKEIKQSGKKYAITFGEASNDNTTKSFAFAGFYPYMLRRKKWFLFRKSYSYVDVPTDMMELYNKLTYRYRPKLIEE